MVVNTGDLVHHNSSDPTDRYPNVDLEYERVRNGTDRIEAAGIPYLQCVGNHEHDNVFAYANSLEAFNHYYPDVRCKTHPWYGGQFAEGESQNIYYKLKIRNVEYIFIATEFLPHSDVMEWCCTIADENPDAIILYFSHEYSYGDRGTGVGRVAGASGYPNPVSSPCRSGVDNPLNSGCMYYSSVPSPARGSGGHQHNLFVSKYPNVIATYSGHYVCRSTVCQTTDIDNSITMHFHHDYSYPYPYDGYTPARYELEKSSIAIVTVDPVKNTATQRVYSPSSDYDVKGYGQDVTYNTIPMNKK